MSTMSDEHRQALETERDQLEERLGVINRRLNEVEFGPLEPEGTGAVMSIYTHNNAAAIALAESFAETLGDAENYVTLRVHHATAGWMEVTIQRAEKMTPAEGRRRAEDEVRRLLGLLAAAGIPEEPRIKLSPPGFSEEEGRYAYRPGGPTWIVIDFNQTPNDMFCKRCGARQALPERMTADAMGALEGVFRKAHLGCTETKS